MTPTALTSNSKDDVAPGSAPKISGKRGRSDVQPLIWTPRAQGAGARGSKSWSEEVGSDVGNRLDVDLEDQGSGPKMILPKPKA